MRVLVLGGYGLIGSAVVSNLLRSGDKVICLTRSVRGNRADVEWRRGDLARMTSPEDWLPLLDDVDAIVNCAGALQDGPRDDLRKVHVDGPLALFRACAQRGIRRIVHVSAAGLESAQTAFARTKQEAETTLCALDLDWFILRPGLVLAPAAYGGTALLRGLAGFPLITPVAEANAIVQTVGIEEIVATVSLCLHGNPKPRVIWELASPEKVTIGEIVKGYRAWLGLQPRSVLSLPHPLVRVAAVFADLAGLLGWRSPMRSTAVSQLAAGVRAAPESWMQATAIAPRSFAATLSDLAASVQERWFARLYFVKPLAILGLSAFWIVSGLISAFPARESAIDLAQRAGLAPAISLLTVAGGAALDILLGLMLLVASMARFALLSMIAVSFLYLGAGIVLAPNLLLDPLGPLVKIVPAVLAALFLLAIMDDR